MKRTLVILLLLIVVFLGFSHDVEAQCAMCKATLESNLQSGAGAVGRGINKGIMYIMFVPYILMAIAGYLIYKHLKGK